MTDELPAPLVPPEVDLRDFSYMPLDVQRLRDSDLSLVASGEEFKAAVLLWCAAWHQVPAGSLPNDERWLARHSGSKTWKKVRAVALRGFVRCTDNRLYHKTISEKAVESWRHKSAQRDRTRQATEARRLRYEERHEHRDDDRDDQRGRQRDVHQGKLREGKGSKEKGKVSQKQKQGPRARKAPLPPDFGISPRVQAWAESKGFQALELHLEAFKSKALAKGYQYVDWDEALMSAVRDDWAGLRKGNGAGHGANPNRQESLEERNLRVARNWKPPEDESTSPPTAATAAQPKE